MTTISVSDYDSRADGLRERARAVRGAHNDRITAGMSASAIDDYGEQQTPTAPVCDEEMDLLDAARACVLAREIICAKHPSSGSVFESVMSDLDLVDDSPWGYAITSVEYDRIIDLRCARAADLVEHKRASERGLFHPGRRPWRSALGESLYLRARAAGLLVDA